ncbi:MAG: DUF4402 domain-containing protein [Alphaproteobacteria bacterium]|nr:DUF4402 domain-containing protein [Alphaproteobacteria bacterium]
MKKLLLSTAIVAILAFSGTAQAVTIQGDADATVITPITIEQTIGLNFASFAPTGTDGYVNTVGPEHSNVDKVGSSNPTAGTFGVGGDTSLQYTLTAPINNQIISLTDDADPANTMSATLTVTNAVGTVGTTVPTVNGVLTVGAEQVPGEYDVTYPVTVAYQ